MIYKDNLYVYNVLVLIVVVLSLHNVYEKLPHTGHILRQYILVFDYIFDMNLIWSGY